VKRTGPAARPKRYAVVIRPVATGLVRRGECLFSVEVMSGAMETVAVEEKLERKVQAQARRRWRSLYFWSQL
jgi:hypothetical protein